MATTTPTGNAAATPNPIAKPTTTNTTTLAPAPVATPAAVQNDALTAQANKGGSVAAMQAAAAAQQPQTLVESSKQNPGTIATGTSTGATAAGQGLPQVSTVQQAYTAPKTPTVTPDTSHAGQVYDPLTGNWLAKTPTGGLASTGAGINPATGQAYEKPSAPTINPVQTPTDTAVINNVNNVNGGVVTSDNFNAASATIGNAITNAQNDPLSKALAASNTYAQSIIDQNNADIAQAQQYAAMPGSDPKYQILLDQKALIASQYNSLTGTIQTQADQALRAQAETNRQLEGQARAAVNAAGSVGSMVGAGYIAAQIQNNQAALDKITSSEQEALVNAHDAFLSSNLELAGKQLDLIDQRRNEAKDLASQNQTLYANMAASIQSAQQFAQQTKLNDMNLRQAGMTDASQRLATFSKQNIAPEAIPQETWNDIATTDGISVSTAKTMYMGSLKDQKASDAKEFAANTTAFYQAASQIKDPNAILYRPNQDGSFTAVKRSEVQTVPNYDTFQTTKNGKNYATYVNKDDPTAKPVEVLLGNVDPKVSYKDDAFGNTLAITDNGDGTFTTQKVLDVAGNPLAHQAIVSTVSNLDASGHPYTQNQGTLPPTVESNGSLHMRGDKPATECGQAVNDWLGTHFPDSLTGKISQCDTTIGTNENPVKVGDAIVTNEAAGTGHVAMISAIGQDEKGTYYQLTESNYKKDANGNGLVETGRKIYSNSGKIQGFARGTKNPFAEQKDGPIAPADNAMSWTVSAKPDAPVTTAIKNGTVQSVDQVGTYANGDPMFMATIKDNDTGTITQFSGIKASELRVGSSWDSSQKPPTIGATGKNGYTVDVRNADGSPVAPTGHSLSAEVAAGQTWGQYDFIPTTPQAQSRYNTILGQVSKGTITLDSALQRMKTDPILGQITPDTYLGDFQDAASTGATAKGYKDLHTMNLNETVQGKQLTEARKIVPAAQFSADPTVKNYRTTVAIMPEITSLENRLSQSDYKVGDAPSDLRLLDSYVRMSTGGTVTEAQGAMIKDNQSPLNKALNIAGSAQYGGFLTPESRKQIIDMAHSLQNEQKKSFDEVAGSYQSQLDDYFGSRGMKSPLDLTKIADINNFTGDVVGRTGQSEAVDQGTQSSDVFDPSAVQIGDTTEYNGQTLTWDGSNWN